MCLYIHHLQKDRGVITTKQHYLVYKVLCRLKPSGKGYMSPYRRMLYEFGRIYKVKLQQPSRYGTVHRGLHATRTRKEAREIVKIESLLPQRVCEYFPAIIPAGSRIYYGIWDDVVSDKLIVFKDMKSLCEWTKNN